LWMGQGGIVDMRGKPNMAAAAAAHLRDNYGLQFPTFSSVKDADAFARKRSENEGASHGSIARQR
ncbi:MAG: hypothetical protein EBU84_05430, partial [Actinobacteria bacterium]|nr:hypothetical protein [Actinomycetota bacterium]